MEQIITKTYDCVRGWDEANVFTREAALMNCDINLIVQPILYTGR